MGKIVDLSQWQGDIDFAKLSGEVDGVILRVQAGSTHADTKYNEYVAGCKQYGISFCTYAYFKGVSINDAVQEAKDAYNRMDKSSEAFAVDIEEQTCHNPSDLVPAGQAFVDYLKQQGVKVVGIYSGEYFYKAHQLDEIKCDFQWIANYGVNDGQKHNPPKIPCDLWQYTSAGTVNGVTGNVDTNALTGSKSLDFFFGTSSIVAPTTKPELTKPTPPKPSASKPALVQKDINHIVVSGDTLSELAVKYNTTVGALKVLNGLKNDTIYVGHILKISVAHQPSKPVSKPISSPSITHMVVPGDTLSELAVKYHTTVSAIKGLNGLKNDTIYVGHMLKIK